MIINSNIVTIQGDLPAGYQRCEYIESSGTQYIATNYTPVANDYIAIKFQTVDTTQSWTNFFGSRGSDNANRRLLQTDSPATTKFLYATASSSSFVYSTITDKNVCWAIVSSNQFSLYDTNTHARITRTTSGLTSPNGVTPIYLFTGNVNNTSVEGKIHGRIYEFKAAISEDRAENGDFAIHLIPCYRIADTEIGMYDIVGRTFYTNAGTGVFTKGADV